MLDSKDPELIAAAKDFAKNRAPYRSAYIYFKSAAKSASPPSDGSQKQSQKLADNEKSSVENKNEFPTVKVKTTKAQKPIPKKE